jgi:hypothetical protein
MLSDSRGSVIISSLGWVDRGSLWIMSVGSGRIETVSTVNFQIIHYTLYITC